MEKQVENLLKDYYWMRNEIDRLEKCLAGSSSPMRSWGVAKYGIESVLSAGSSIRSQAELKNLDIREERLYKRLVTLQSRVYAIETATEDIEGEISKIVYECILDGMTYREIGFHLGLSKDKIRELKREIIRTVAKSERFRILFKELVS